MTEEIATRLLEAIAANRLLLFCGAGLSMSPPSSLPGAYTVAQTCAARYQHETGNDLQPDIIALSRYFRANNRLEWFISHLVPWSILRGDPNPGHRAIADFLGCKVFLAAVTTNFDTLIERAADHLGEPDFRAIVDVDDLPQDTPHAGLLKLHGCEVRARLNTIWCPEQLEDEPIVTRTQRFRAWLAEHLPGRDVLFIGFWSDWKYLTELLAESLADTRPQHVYLVDPDTDTNLRLKAPELWAWAHADTVSFHHIADSGAEFLDQLRKCWSRRFLSMLDTAASGTVYEALFGEAPDAPLVLDAYDAQTLYALRRDLTGTPRNAIVRDRIPQEGDHVAAVFHRRLLESGALYTEYVYSFRGRRLRLISGRGRLLSAVGASYQHEPPLVEAVDTVICAGAVSDPSPPNIIRPVAPPTIVRPGSGAAWVTHEQLLEEFAHA